MLPDINLDLAGFGDAFRVLETGTHRQVQLSRLNIKFLTDDDWITVAVQRNRGQFVPQNLFNLFVNLHALGGISECTRFSKQFIDFRIIIVFQVRA